MTDKNGSFTDFPLGIVDYSAVALFVINPEHRVIFWNKACEELTGVRASEVLGTDEHWQAFYGEARPCLADIVINGAYDEVARHYRKYGKSPLLANGLHAEGWYDNLSGKRRYIIFDAAPVYNPDGALIAAIETLQDITDDRLAADDKESKIAELQDALAKSTTLKGFLHVCAWCRNIHDEKGLWVPIEEFLSRHSRLSHGICPDCIRIVSPELYSTLQEEDE
ncbi:MAG TPA: PAS domain-containing protein [Thermodesulfovibrionales bacterium]|nr:PAS domain-containing protein [Thermodesulfovibrionales bacterium]